ncbi:MAG TPA: ATP phosphoribosyltransferase [Polyangiaceae bacterium]|nr:ATP phosphoribosyltransferase [Polyangiaceae bacterium]
MSRPLTIAIPKGRVSQQLAPLLEAAGIGTKNLLADDRRLVRDSDDGSARFLLLKPDDVPTYVEYGAADLGISGRDVLLERRYDLYQPLDLGIGRCTMAVAGPAGAKIGARPRVATKFPRIAGEHFARRGVQAEIIYVGGSVELSPLVGLSDVIVDIVESGATLRENDLHVMEHICDISSVLVANRSLYKLRHREIAPLIEKLAEGVARRA